MRHVVACIVAALVIQIAWVGFAVVHGGIVPFVMRPGSVNIAYYFPVVVDDRWGVYRYIPWHADIEEGVIPISPAQLEQVKKYLEEPRIVHVISYGWPRQWCYSVFPLATTPAYIGYARDEQDWSRLRNRGATWNDPPRTPLAIPRVYSVWALLINVAFAAGMLGGVVYAAHGVVGVYRRVRHKGLGCARCGYSKEGLRNVTICPECGAEWVDQRVEAQTGANGDAGGTSV